MTSEVLTVHVPTELYKQLEKRAQHTQRSIEQELIEVVAEAVAFQDEDNMRVDMLQSSVPLANLSDSELWTIGQTSHLSPAAASYLEDLTVKQQRDGLTAEERVLLTALLQQYDRAMLVRAEALALLTERGQDITPLLQLHQA